MDSACLLVTKHMLCTKHLFCLSYSFLCLGQFPTFYSFFFQCCAVSLQIHLMWSLGWVLLPLVHLILFITSTFLTYVYKFAFTEFIRLPRCPISGSEYVLPEFSLLVCQNFWRYAETRREESGETGVRGWSNLKVKEWFFRAGPSCFHAAVLGPPRAGAQIKWASSLTLLSPLVNNFADVNSPPFI